MTNNNLSKKLFKQFLKNNKQFKKVEGNRQVFYLNGEKWCFSVSDTKAQCRQFYEDCKGFVTYMLEDSKYLAARVDNPSQHTWSRTMKNGIRAYSVKPDNTLMRNFECF